MVYAHVFSGADTAVPAYHRHPPRRDGPESLFSQGAGWKRIERNEPVIVDFAGSYDGYLVDQTRIFAIGGISDRLRKGYDDMLKVQERMTETVAAGVPWGRVYDDCLELCGGNGVCRQLHGGKGGAGIVYRAWTGPRDR